MSLILGQEKFFKYFFYTLLLLGASCAKDDAPHEDGSNKDDFFEGSYSSASIDDLSGVWAIFSVQYEGELREVPVVYESCGRDFFVYFKDGTYHEYLYQSSFCDPQINKLKWKLNKGVISLNNSIGQSEDLVITKLNDQELVFKSRFDIDGELETLILYAKKYEAPEIDLVSHSFKKNDTDAFEKLISFTWDKYEGFNPFQKYEIYRSSGEGCSKANSILVTTITDPSITEFTDLGPPSDERVCYYLKVYTKKGLLGESDIYDVTPGLFAYPDPITLQPPVVSTDQIVLNWETSESPYFSYYEIVVSDDYGSSGQARTIAIIKDKEVTSYTHRELPYYENPIYSVTVHNIYGNISTENQNATVSQEAIFKRKEIIGLKSIYSYAIDSEEPVVYFYGQESGPGIQPVNIRRYNYETQETEAISDLYPASQTNVPIKIVFSPNGKEIVIKQGIELHFYDAKSMEYKYAIDPEGVFSISDFVYIAELDLWAISDGDDVFILKRDNANLFLIDSAPHFKDHQGSGNYLLYPLKDNRLLIGHSNEPNSIVYTLDDNGKILDHQSVPIRIRSLNGEKTIYNKEDDYILDTSQNRLYSTNSFQFLESFESPNFPSGTSNDGYQIYGTNNDPDWNITVESLHKKEAIVYDRNLGTRQQFKTNGYPQVIFENFKGDIFSISSGLKKNTIDWSNSDKADFFIEKVGL